MKITVSIMMDPGDEVLTLSPTEISDAILTALDGDVQKDSVTSQILQPPDTGTVGVGAPPA